MSRRIATCPSCGGQMYEQSRQCAACDVAARREHGHTARSCLGCGRRVDLSGREVADGWCKRDRCRPAWEGATVMAPRGPPDWERIERHMAAVGQQYEDVAMRPRGDAVRRAG